MTAAAKRPSTPRALALAPFMERVHARYHHPARIGMDPLRWPRLFDRRDDREVAAYLAASLAYGNVAQINRSLEDLFRRMGPSPAKFARNFVPGKSDLAIGGFYHRFNNARDLSALVHSLGQMLRAHGSIEGFWAAAQSGATPAPGETIADRAGRFMDAALHLDFSPYFPRGLSAREHSRRDTVLYLFPDAAGPSACKRLHMFLRWVVRPDDGVDLGLWSVERPAGLEYPVDTHIHRISRFLGATRRNAADARTRREITDFFGRISPLDPVRYDFSLCRMGILRECPTRSRIEVCDACELKSVCRQHRRLAASAGRARARKEALA